MDAIVPQEEKRCPGCDKVKSFDEYHVNARRKDGRCFYCKECHTGRNKVYNKKNYVSEVAREKHLLRTYGITSQQYAALLEKQNGVCACCKRPEMIFSNRANAEFRLAVDHDHVTGEVRALLCMACNTALGAMEEDLKRIEALLVYARSLKGA